MTDSRARSSTNQQSSPEESGANASPRSPHVKLLRTPRSGMRTSTKLRQAFKSPFRPKQTESSPPPLNPEEEKKSIKEKIKSIEEEIAELQKEYDVSELQDHIDKLHEYNDIKDAGQLILGRLAEIKGKTTKQMYEEFGLDIND
ncbi:DNA repair protein SWI5 homolog [Actinia tenebrosa]|uniref:DNA repair protein SWI5 homolog n=1 Tax=Actinia tenebrosa TaxID=6105 RepID=A0A6P8J3Z6_ACTTE|nr:DNA repair protein SWI5 homolog [Actinia tenebrosa]